MKRAPAISAVLLLACAGGATAIASASTHGSTALAARAAKVQVSHSSLGNILTTSSGSTLFEFTRDSAGKDSCAKVSGCLQIWPALTTSGRPVAGSGVRASLLSSVKLSGGSSQVTYAGHPLYLYSGDSRADETGYVGVSSFGGTWEAINASGHAVKAAKSSASSGSGSSTSSGGGW